MHDDLERLVEGVLGHFFMSHGFVPSSSLNRRNGLISEVVYVSSECKVKLYDSQVDGEINCLLATVSTPDGADWARLDRAFYLRDLLEVGKGLPLEELMQVVASPARGRQEQLIQIRNLLLQGYKNALANLRVRTPS